MQQSYPAIYQDTHGKDRTTIKNDGKTLTTTIRGVEFQGDFDALVAIPGTDPDKLSSFSFVTINTFGQPFLCSYEIECWVPMPVPIGSEETEGNSHVRLSMGEPKSVGGVDREDLRLTLTYRNGSVSSSGKSGWFEDELLEMQASLPSDVYMKACINCAFSDYSPYGHGLFGGLACFRNNKEGYRKVNSKDDLFKIWHTLTEFVQETYLCPEFERREPGTGYRG
jgi:hypothetical protein